jgi:hypothetical protein
MKITFGKHRNRSRRGSSVVIVLLMIAVLFMYINATLKTLHILGRDVTLVEKHQVAHWQRFKPGLTITNDLTEAGGRAEAQPGALVR